MLHAPCSMYLIDGYNLLYETDLETRDDLVRMVHDFCSRLNKNAIIVFDGYSPEDLSTTLVEVKFVGDADLEITQIMKKNNNPTALTLISSDKDLIYSANQNKIKVIKSEQFEYLIPEQNDLIKDDDLQILTDEQVKEQLEEFNYFKKEKLKNNFMNFEQAPSDEKLLEEQRQAVSEKFNKLFKTYQRKVALFAYEEEITGTRLEVHELLKLNEKEQEVVVCLYGKTLARIRDLNLGEVRFWNNFIDEVVKNDSKDSSDEYKQVLNKVLKNIALRKAVFLNSSTRQDPKLSVPEELERFAMELQLEDKLELQEKFLNPFGIKKSLIFYKPGTDGQSLQEVEVLKVAKSQLDPELHEYNSEVTLLVEGKEEKIKLDQLNRKFVRSAYALRDGSNLYGNLALPKVDFESGQEIEFVYHAPMNDINRKIVWQGTNEAELTEKYGEAWKQFWRGLLFIKDGKSMRRMVDCEFKKEK